MAVVVDMPSFDDFHLEAAQFDALLDASAAPAKLRTATRCGCWDQRTGQPDPACRLCSPFGYLYDDEIDVRVFGPNRKPTRRIEAQGTYDATDAFFTFPTGVVPPLYSRFTLPLSIITVDDILTKGSEDTIRYGHPLVVERAHYVTRNPTSGQPYVHELHLLTEGADFRRAGRVITWLNRTVPDGTRYVLRFTAFAEWVVWEPQDRNEGGKLLPYRFHCRQMDFLLHPRGEEPQRSY